MDLHRPRAERRDAQVRRPSRTLLGGCLLVTMAVAACSGDSGGSGEADDGSAEPASAAADTATQPTAPDSQRVDLDTPSFSDPTAVDNPLFPIGELHSAVLLGNEERHPLRIETVLLPEPKVIEVDGQEVETLVSQFVAYVDGRIHEVALDWYAQDDAGNVWYFGEDVFNYEDGVVADTDGTWIAGEDGPIGMIMPADPQVGQAYRPENIPDFVFEEVVVKAVDSPWTVRVARSPAPWSAPRTTCSRATSRTRPSPPATASSGPASGPTSKPWRWRCPTTPGRAACPAELEAISTRRGRDLRRRRGRRLGGGDVHPRCDGRRVGGPPGDRHGASAAGRRR